MHRIERRHDHHPRPGRRLLAVLFGWLLLMPMAHAADILGVAFDGTVSRIDTATGTGSTIGNAGFTGLNSLARNSASEFFSVAGDAFAPSSTLIRIDSITGLGTSVATVNLGLAEASVRALAFSPTGVLYALNNGGGKFSTTDPDDLYILDPLTGLGTLIGNTGLPGLQGLEFASDGRLFAWDIAPTPGLGKGLVLLDPLTGLAADVNPLLGEAAGVDIQTLAFNSSGSLYGGRTSLYVIDPATGATTLVGSGGYDARGMAFLADDGGPSQEIIPEPSSWLLMGVGLCGLLAAAWRAQSSRARRRS